MITINTGVTPTDIAFSNDKIYVANNNNYGISGQDSIGVICSTVVIKTIYDASFNQPYTLTIHKNKLYVTNSNSTTVTIICTKNDKVIGVIDGFDGPSGMVVHGNIGYVNNYGGPEGLQSGNGTTVSVVCLSTNTIVGTIVTGLAPAALAINKKYLYVANYVDGNIGTGTLNIISLKTNEIVRTESGLFGPFDIILDDCNAYITNFGSNNFAPFGNTVTIINLKTYKQKHIRVGIQPAGITIHNNKLYVTNYNTLYAGSNYSNLTPGQGTVDIIDLTTKKIIKTIAVGQGPANIKVHHDKIYVTNYISNTLNVIKI